MRLSSRSLVEAIIALTGILFCAGALSWVLISIFSILFHPNNDHMESAYAGLVSGAVLFLLGLILYKVRKPIAKRISPEDAESYLLPQSLVAVGAAIISISFLANGVRSLATCIFMRGEASLIGPYTKRIQEAVSLLMFNGISSILVGLLLFFLSAKIGRLWNSRQAGE